MFRTLALSVVLTWLSGCGAPPETASDGAAAADVLTIRDARVRSLIPGRDMTAAYFTAENRGSEPVVLVGASSSGARAVEMHVTERDGEMTRMRRLSEVEIPAGGTVRFEPGGRHLMLFGVTQLNGGMDIDLERRDGTRSRVRFETIPMGGE